MKYMSANRMMHPTRRDTIATPASATGDFSILNLFDDSALLSFKLAVVEELWGALVVAEVAEGLVDEAEVADAWVVVDVEIKVTLADAVCISDMGIATRLADKGARFASPPGHPDAEADGSAVTCNQSDNSATQKKNADSPSSCTVITKESTVVVELSNLLSGKLTKENECFILGSKPVCEKRIYEMTLDIRRHETMYSKGRTDGVSVSVVLCASTVCRFPVPFASQSRHTPQTLPPACLKPE